MAKQIYRIDICDPARAPEVKRERIDLGWTLHHDGANPAWSIDIQEWPAPPAPPAASSEFFGKVVLVFSRPAPAAAGT